MKYINLLILINLLLYFLIFLIFFLQIVFFTTCERKILSLTQRRIGPNLVGDKGRLQYISDALKLVVKLYFSSRKINNLFFQNSAVFIFYISWLSFLNLNYSYGENINDIEYNIFFSVICSLGFSIAWLISGWSSISKYAILGCFRSGVQIISYEVIVSSILLVNFLVFGSVNFEEISKLQQNISFFFILPIIIIVYFLASLMETNRPPFDLSEAESDVVAGYIVEYSGILFGLFYLGEYINIFTNSFFILISFTGYHFEFLYLIKNILINFGIINN